MWGAYQRAVLLEQLQVGVDAACSSWHGFGHPALSPVSGVLAMARQAPPLQQHRQMSWVSVPWPEPEAAA